jgi:secondary thiamine-phosphate synthase enzyme
MKASSRTLRVRTTACLEFVDVTEAVHELVAASGVRHGIVNVQVRHTTAAICVNESEPLLLEDLRATLERCAPRGVAYRHDDFEVRTVNLEPGEPPNGHSHCKALFLRASETLNVVDGRLQLGRWQRVFLLELDGGRERSVSLLALGC